jgi:hypothetical protein
MSTEDEPTYILNVNDGRDTLHDPRHLTERCNTDQIEGRQSVDEMTAEAMVARGDAVRCEHCKPDLPVEV